MKPIEANRGDRTGASTSSKQYFQAVFPDKPEPADVREAQIGLGYHPGGYGGPNLTSTTQLSDGTWAVHWYCWASCD